MDRVKERQVNQLMDSLSGIDGDLLMDVAPPAPVRQVKKQATRQWKRWTSVAAGLVFLVMIAFIVRISGRAGQLNDKALLPAEHREDGIGYGDSETKGGSPESQDFPGSVGDNRGIAESSRAMMDLTDRVSADLLCGCGADNRAYSPAGLYQALHLNEGEGDRQGFRVEDLQEQGVDLHYQASLEAATLVQKIQLNVRAKVMTETYESPEGILFYLVAEALAFTREGEETVMAKVPVEGGMLYVLLPDEGRTPDDLLAEGSLFSNLIELEGPGQSAGLRMPSLSIQVREDISGQVMGEEAGGLSQDFAAIRQEVQVGLIPLSVGNDSPPSLLIDLDRPFIFLITDDEGIPLIAGVLRDPPAN